MTVTIEQESEAFIQSVMLNKAERRWRNDNLWERNGLYHIRVVNLFWYDRIYRTSISGIF